MQCDVKSDFQFDGHSPLLNENKSCLIEDNSHQISQVLILKWPSEKSYILDSSFKIYKLFEYLDYFYGNINLNIMNLRGFDISLIESNLNLSFNYSVKINMLFLINSEISFYIGKEKVKSCQDFHNKNVSEISSIFQIKNSNYQGFINLNIYKCEFK